MASIRRNCCSNNNRAWAWKIDSSVWYRLSLKVPEACAPQPLANASSSAWRESKRYSPPARV